MGSIRNEIIILHSNNISQKEMNEFCKCCSLHVKEEFIGKTTCYEEFELEVEEVDKIFEIANILFKDVELTHIINEENNTIDWYYEYYATYNENKNGKKVIEVYDYCTGYNEVNGKNVWKILKDDIEEKAKKKKIEIEWSNGKNFYPKGDKFENFCDDFVEKKGGLKEISTKITNEELPQILINYEDIERILDNAKFYNYNSLLQKLEKEFSKDSFN